jgi:uncharacterized protein with PQ loop repeat
MNSDSGWPSSFAGFLDYSSCYPPSQAIIWQVVGWGLLAGTILSVIPQIRLIIHRRSSFGLNSFAIFVTSFGQFIIAANVLCLRTADFIGFLQYPMSRTLPRLQTFINYVGLWITYLPIAFLNMIFFDTEPRLVRSGAAIQGERYFNRMLTILTTLVSLVILVVYVGGVVLQGYGSAYLMTIGMFFGTLATFMCIAQYVPQMITTCKIKGSGSLSLLLLAIQSPGGFVNSAFMAFGQGDNWTTWLSILAAAIQQAILLGICLVFNARQKKRRETASESNLNMSETLLGDHETYN